ncbi:hypothetical protein DFR86_07590 [Acidianus sulfidivorans JP7]|uniref:Metalloprotease TldD/E C-terminal domain-containing protein n=1 Tax=Acidianus sulfidivorans JP7 TaxID=619593 RepID=A0A2U9IN44_9CREN|nr:metallopeptidase TldD-related protein [Acidianus sulfidivorans]AWR97425.1 hypothetical protein DFR86_07590 [Acidianus sulfidivorans JP7]
MNTYQIKEEIINITPYGSFREYNEKKAIRYFKNGTWYINQKIENEDTFEKSYEQCESFVHPSVRDWENVDRIISNIQGINATIKKVTRQIIFNNSKLCIEEKIMNYINYEGEKFAFIGNISDIKNAAELLKIQKINTMERVWDIDRTSVILDPEASANLFHQLTKLIRGNDPKLKLGERIFSEDITVYDNPQNPYLIGSQAFDDEGVKTSKKQLIADGVLNSYLGTLSSKYGEPGNARGIIPEPDYFNLEVKQGDWHFKELIEDTKSGILVIGAYRSEILKNSIRIFPKKVLLINGGGIIVREIAITFQDLLTIDAISRDIKSAYVDESHGAITPFIRLKAKPIIY